MIIYLAGSGKLAQAILNADIGHKILKWADRPPQSAEKSIVVHAGSGRELPECLTYCYTTGSTLIELSTGLETETMQPDFPLILCPNTSVLLLKTLNMLRLSGHYFRGCKISILESHQASKTSAPGTAFSFADSLDVPTENIISVRQINKQLELGIPQEYLERHAYHKIVIEDGHDQLTIETRILGHESYADGVQKIINAVMNNRFEQKRYSILDLIDQNLL